MSRHAPTVPQMMEPMGPPKLIPITPKRAPATAPPTIPRMILTMIPFLLFMMTPARNPHKPPTTSESIRCNRAPIMISFQDLDILYNDADYTTYSTCYQICKIMFDKGFTSTYTILACVQRTYYALTAQ